MAEFPTGTSKAPVVRRTVTRVRRKRLQALNRATSATLARRPLYLSTRIKFSLNLVIAAAWAVISYRLAGRWIADLTVVVGSVLAHIAILSIAIIPGFMNAFMACGLLLDRRPLRRRIKAYPDISIIIAAYNEQDSIASTIESIAQQNYPGALDVIVVDDGSTDNTLRESQRLSYPWLRVLDLQQNGGKAKALNTALKLVRYPITITLDADSLLHRDALTNLVGRLVSDPVGTAAVAGAVLVRNSRLNFVTKIQEWDYFHGIAAVKRLQSFYHGTLVAQGAFSIYRTAVLHEVGGWPDCVGEDIVLTWAILRRGYRVGFAEDAVAFTNVPVTLVQLVRQRQRWSRGLIEAFRHHWPLLLHLRMTTLFIWWNLMFPILDLTFTFLFIPGIALALAGVYWLAGPMTLLVLPLATLINQLMYRIQSGMFVAQRLKVRRNPIGFLAYVLLYSFVLQPACVIGYCKELLGMRKLWGTK
jgi:biofilm PGA synthesis N-glycosyltransferase PgaC